MYLHKIFLPNSKTLDAEKEKTKVWKFHRVALVREFQRRSIMPPFVIVDAIITLFKKCFCQKSVNSNNPWSMYFMSLMWYLYYICEYMYSTIIFMSVCLWIFQPIYTCTTITFLLIFKWDYRCQFIREKDYVCQLVYLSAWFATP